MKNKIINILIVITIIAIVILGYFIFSKYYFNYVNEKNIEKFIKNNFDMTNGSITKDVSGEKIVKEERVQIPLYEGYNVLGMISIDKINLSYPIIEANKNKDEALNVSIIKFYGNNLNENGNVVLAGHNYYDNTMFAKLHMLNLDDKIKIVDCNKRLIEYVVYDIYNASPNDTKCLETLDANSKELTLITCTKGNLERLVIKAKEIK